MDQWSRLTTRPCIDLMRVAAALCPAAALHGLTL